MLENRGFLWYLWAIGDVEELSCEYLEQFRDGVRRHESGLGKNSAEFYV